MLQVEISLAASSPYDITYMDGSLTTALIHMYKAVNLIKGGIDAFAASEEGESFVSVKIKDNFEDFLTSYKKILLGDAAAPCDAFEETQKHAKTIRIFARALLPQSEHVVCFFLIEQGGADFCTSCTALGWIILSKRNGIEENSAHNIGTTNNIVRIISNVAEVLGRYNSKWSSSRLCLWSWCRFKGCG